MLEERDLHLRGKSFHVCLLVKHRCGKENKLVIMTDGGRALQLRNLVIFFIYSIRFMSEYFHMALLTGGSFLKNV
jgi:hypothetical protein